MIWHPHGGGNGPFKYDDAGEIVSDPIVMPRIRCVSRDHVEAKGIPMPASKWRWPWGRQQSPGDIVEYMA